MKKKFIIMIFVMLIAMCLTACAETYETQVVTGEIIEKEYDKEERKKKKVKQSDGTYKEVETYKPQEWEIVVAYGEMQKEYEFSNSMVFNKYKEGDKIPLLLTKGIDKEGKVVWEQIEWEEK